MCTHVFICAIIIIKEKEAYQFEREVLGTGWHRGDLGGVGERNRRGRVI